VLQLPEHLEQVEELAELLELQELAAAVEHVVQLPDNRADKAELELAAVDHFQIPLVAQAATVATVEQIAVELAAKVLTLDQQEPAQVEQVATVQLASSS
jgi:pantothenate kinase